MRSFPRSMTSVLAIEPLSLRMRRSALPFMTVLLTGFVATACVYMFFLDPWGHDTWFHLRRLQDIEQQFGRGQFPAYLAENVAQDRGLPVWIYYSQWVYWPAMLLTSLGASPMVSLKLVYCAFLIVACAGCYRLLRLHTDERGAVFVTLLFVTSNYVIGELFVRSAYAEFLSVALMPWLLLALHRTLLDGAWVSGVALVLLASLTILFHLLSFMNAACALAAYAAYVAIGWRVPGRQLLRLVPLFALALGLTAFFWLPAVVETRYVLGAKGVPTPLHETFLPAWRYFHFISITNLGFVLTLSAGIVAGSVLLRKNLPNVPTRRPVWPLVAGIVAYIFLTLRASEPLYTAFPLLASTLWVWRVMFPLTLLVVILVAGHLEALPERLRSSTVLAAVAGLAILQAAVVVGWDSAPYFSTRPMERQKIEEMLASGGGAMKGFGIDEYLPDPQVVPRPSEECGAIRDVVPEGRYEMRFVVADGDADACIHIPRYWNVRYAASIDGEPMPVYANADQEVLLVPGRRTGQVSVRFIRPAHVTLSLLVSSITAAFVLFRVASPRFSRRSASAVLP